MMFLFLKLISYFWLCWVFIAVCELSLVGASGVTLHWGAGASPWAASLALEHSL